MSVSSLLARCGPWAVVSGASSGLGASFCRALAKRGFNIVLSARREAELQAVATELRGTFGVRTRVVAADLSVSVGVVRVGDATSTLDVGLLVCCAGVQLAGAYLSHDLGRLNDLVRVNTSATAILAATIGRRIASRGRGGVIFVSSLGARPMPYLAAYSASKAFVSALALALRQEWQAHGVVVLAFEPGVVRTGMTDAFLAATQHKLRFPSVSPEDAVEKCLRSFGRRARCTTGCLNAVFRRYLDWLPYSITLWLSSVQMRKVLREDLVRPEI